MKLLQNHLNLPTQGPCIPRTDPTNAQSHRNGRQAYVSAEAVEVGPDLPDTAPISPARAGSVLRSGLGPDSVQPDGGKSGSPAGIGADCADFLRYPRDAVRFGVPGETGRRGISDIFVAASAPARIDGSVLE